MIKPLSSLMLDLAVLWIGSHSAVTGYENLARRLKLSHWFIRLSAVAVGTLGVAFVGIVLVGL